MMIVFLSNFLNHHQLPLCKALFEKTKGQFVFIATEPIHEERINMGYEDMNHKYDFVLCSYDSIENKQKALKLCFDCDVLIHGSAPDEYFKSRVKAKKLTFKYGERFFKTPFTIKNVLPRTLSMLKHVIPYQNKNHYLLCASAYMPKDCAIYGCFKNRCFKWGYFPECKKYEDIDALIASKKKNSLLWCGRLIDWKHPELAISVAKRLKDDGYDFTLDIVGTGILENEIAEMIKKNDLSDRVFMRGAMPPEKVREYMEQSELYLFTSDRQEGWGAVLNESMNSACAVVANNSIGSVPFVIANGENGMIYSDGNVDESYNKVKLLLDDANERKRVAKNAYLAITEEWNVEIAAEKLVSLCSELNSSSCDIPYYNTGVCSKAYVIKDNCEKK